MIDHIFVIPGDSLIAYIEYAYFYQVMNFFRNIIEQKEHRDIDSYIISHITFSAPGIPRYRGVSLSDTQKKLVEKYYKCAVDKSDNQYWRYYDGDGKRLFFQIINDKVSRIMLALNPDENGI